MTTKTTLSRTKRKCELLLPHWKELLLELSANCPDEQELFIYIAACTIGNLHIEDSDCTPIARDFIRKNFGRRPNWKRLLDAGLIRIKPYVPEVSSREYALPDWAIEMLIGSDYHEDTNCQPEIDAVPEHDSSLPNVILSSLYEVEHNEREYNRVAVEQVIRVLSDAQCNSKNAAKRFYNDHFRYARIKYRSRHVSGDIWCYRPRYRASFGGRISEHGGFQSMSGESKAASVRGLSKYVEYDLEASQPNALRLWFDKAGINTKWLDDYLSTENYKEVYAARLGVETEVWKKLMLSLIFAASVPERITKPKNGRGARFNNSIGVALYESTEGNIDQANVLLKKFRELTAALVDGIEQFKSVYLPKYIAANRKVRLDENLARIHYITNTVGMRLDFNRIINQRKGAIRSSTVIAFLLHGTEVGFIHTITGIGHRYGYKVVANDHDAVLVTGVIPPEAVEEARQLSGFKYVKLVKKDKKQTSTKYKANRITRSKHRYDIWDLALAGS